MFDLSKILSSDFTKLIEETRMVIFKAKVDYIIGVQSNKFYLNQPINC